MMAEAYCRVIIDRTDIERQSEILQTAFISGYQTVDH